MVSLKSAEDAFCQGNYRSAIDMIKQVPFSQVSPTMVLIYLDCQKRLDHDDEVRRVESLYLQRFGADPGLSRLPGIALRGESPDEALQSTNNQDERCRIHFWVGRHKEGLGESAYEDYLAAVLSASTANEHRLAQVRLGVPENESREAAGQTVLKCLSARRYDDCVLNGLDWLRAGLAYDPVVQATIVSLERLGCSDRAAQLGQRCLSTDPDPLETALLRLTLGQIKLAPVLELATTPTDQCRALCYWGLRLATLNQTDEAIKILSQAAATRADCTELQIARAELAQVKGMSAPEDRRQVHPRWEQLRIFVSSTFLDMHAERELLVREVFPNLRRICAQRRVFLREVDLRWGVTSEEDVFDRCRREIEASDIVLCLLGERYGWVGLNDAGESITSREIDLSLSLASLKGSGPACFFYFRDPELTASVPQEWQSEYLEQDPWRREQQAALKTRIQAALHQRDQAPRVYGTPARWDTSYCPPWDPQTRGAFVDLEDFGRRVTSDLESVIDARFPLSERGLHSSSASSSVEDEALDEAMDQTLHRHTHEKLFIGRRQLLDQLEAFGLEGYGKHEVAVLQGPPGAGKSAVMAKLVERLNSLPEVTVLWHFIGAAPGSASPAVILMRLCRLLGVVQERIQSTKRDIRLLKQLLEEALESQPSSHRVILLIDGLDQLSYTDSRDLRWLFFHLPSHCRLIASLIHSVTPETTRSTGEWAYESFKKLGVPFEQMAVEPLTFTERRSLIRSYLDAFGKHLSDESELSLARKAESATPLYLLVGLDELRTFGGPQAHLRVAEEIDAFPSSTEAMFDKVLERLENQNRQWPEVVRVTLGSILLSRSRQGMTEWELNRIAERVSGSGNQGTFSRVLTAIRTYLAEYVDSRGSVLWTFFHDQLAEAVRRRYRLNTIEQQQRLHSEIAGSFDSIANPFRPSAFESTGSDARWQGGEKDSDQLHRPLTEIVFHMVRAGTLWKQTADVLCDIQFIAARCRGGLANNLVADYEDALAKWPGFQRYRPFGRPAHTPTWLRECTHAVLEGEPDPHPTMGAGPLLRKLRRKTEPVTELLVLNLETGLLTKTLPGHYWDVLCITGTPGGSVIVTGSADTTARVWSAATGQCTGVLQGHTKAVLDVAITADGRFCMTAGADGKLLLWDLPATRLLGRLPRQGYGGVSGVSMTWDGSHAFVDSFGSLEIWDVASAIPIHNLKIASPLLVTPDGRMAFSASGKKLTVQSLSQPYPGYRIDREDSPEFRVLACTPEGRLLLTGGDDSSIWLWDVHSGDVIQKVEGRSAPIRALALTADGGRAVCLSADGWARVWDLRRRQCILDIHACGGTPTQAFLTADGETLIVAGQADELRRVKQAGLRNGQKIFAKPYDEGVPPRRRAKPAIRLGDPASVESATHRLEAFAHFVAQNEPILSQPGTDVIAVAYNYAENGPVAEATELEASQLTRPWIAMEDRPLAAPDKPALLAAIPVPRSSYHTDKLVLSEDGTKALITGDENLTLLLYDLEHKSLIHALSGHSEEIRSLAMTPDARLGFSAAGDGTLRVWDLSTGVCLRVIPSVASSVAITDDGRIGFSGGRGAGVSVWALDDGALIRKLSGIPESEQDPEFVASPDGKVLVMRNSDVCQYVFDVTTGRILRHHFGDKKFIDMHPGGISRDGRIVQSYGGNPACLSWWNTETGAVYAEVLLDKASFRSASPDGTWTLTTNNLLAMSEDEKEIEVTARHGPDEVKRLPLGEWTPRPAAISPSGDTAVILAEPKGHRTAKGSKALLVWDLAGEVSPTTSGEAIPTKGSAVSPDFRLWAQITGKNFFYIRSTTTGGWLRSMGAAGTEASEIGHTKSVECLDFSPDGRLVACGAHDETLTVWEIESGQCRWRSTESDEWNDDSTHTGEIMAVRFTPDGRHVVSASKDHTARIWDAATGVLVGMLGKPHNLVPAAGHTGVIFDLAIEPRGRLAVTAGMDQRVLVWNLANCRAVAALQLEPARGDLSVAYAVKITSDGRYVLAGTSGNELLLWDLRRGTFLTRLPVKDEVFGITPIHPTGAFSWTNKLGIGRRARLVGINSGPMRVTAVVRWHPDLNNPSPELNEPAFRKSEAMPGRYDQDPTVACPSCYQLSEISAAGTDAIFRIRVGAGSPGESPCRSLPAEAWDEPSLRMKCSHCERELLLNPFVVDARV